MSGMAAKKVAILLGKCLPAPVGGIRPNVSKILITKMELDTYLNMYFKSFSHVFAHDPEKKCKSGDVVLIEELQTKFSKEVTHRVVEIVYPMGDVVDPLTNRKVVMNEFREDIVEKNKLYGENEKAFKYEKAPPRGRLEGIQDFTDKETYKKYQETGEKQPYGYH